MVIATGTGTTQHKHCRNRHHMFTIPAQCRRHKRCSSTAAATAQVHSHQCSPFQHIYTISTGTAKCTNTAHEKMWTLPAHRY
eukprot:1159091-Pelagomonas_calceolata.AAC.4